MPARVTAAEFHEVRGLEHISTLVQEIEAVDRLCFRDDCIVKAKRPQRPQSISAKAQAGTDWLKLIRLFVDFDVPAEETQAVRRCQPGYTRADNSCALFLGFSRSHL